MSSGEHKGMHGKGITAFSYFPLSVANPKEAPSLIAQAAEFIEEQKASGKLPAGLADQYDLQLAALRDDTLPDLEVALMPSFFTTVCAWPAFPSTRWMLKFYIQLPQSLESSIHPL
jgi:hypothetical protein